MNPAAIGAVVFGCAFGGALAGVMLRALLPEHQVGDQSKETVRLGFGLIATMTALVLGLVTASAKSSFDDVARAVKESAGTVLTLDRALARYGPQTGKIREALKQAVASRVETVWPRSASRPGRFDPSDEVRGPEVLAARISGLAPQTDEQRWLQSRALNLAESLLGSRWMAIAGLGSSVPLPFLAVLLFWIATTFASFGLFAKPNATVLSVLFACALSVACAVFLVVEMEGPFEGWIKVSPDPLDYALTHLNR